ncbi:MAG: hypothetical protein ACRET2_14075 [Steroidobacteraceae bacterium]
MSQKSLHAARPLSERRPAIWPWVLMPLVALALFFALRSVRHSTQGGPIAGAAAQAPGSSAR